VAAVEAMYVEFWYIRYEATPLLSYDADHFKVTVVWSVAVAIRFVGAVGGTRSFDFFGAAMLFCGVKIKVSKTSIVIDNFIALPVVFISQAPSYLIVQIYGSAIKK